MTHISGFLLFWCLSPVVMAQTDSERLHGIFNGYFQDKLLNYPEIATSIGANEHNDRWTDWSGEART